MPVIEVKDLVKTYVSGWVSRTRVEALRGATFNVEAGEIFGILGPNGAGKTTLMKVLTGLISATSGTAQLFDKSVNSSSVRSKVGYLPEHHRFPEYLTGAQALEYYGCLSGMTLREVRVQMDETLDLVGMREWKDTPLSNYSKGMGQRLGIAQAIVHNPDIVFLDEPTDGVDPVGRTEIRNVLNTLRDQGKTVFVNSHLLQEVEVVCQRVSIMSHGKVLKTGTIAEITASEPQTKIRVNKSFESVLDQLKKVSGDKKLSEQKVFGENGQQLFEILLSTKEQSKIDEAVDIIREKKLSIVEMRPVKVSLEAAFLEAIDGQRQVGAKSEKPHKAKVLKAKAL